MYTIYIHYLYEYRKNGAPVIANTTENIDAGIKGMHRREAIDSVIDVRRCHKRPKSVVP